MHWTYKPKPSEDEDLFQGDIIEPTEGLNSLFQDVHPHFMDRKYRGFLVLTQTCDLARRGQKCSATHISIAVIRSLQDVISDPLRDQFGYLAPGIYAEHTKKGVEMMVERLINQNENSLGLFYLHPDIDVGIAAPSVAILRVSISVRGAHEHYQTLQKARIGSLSESFQPKLGWMVGNLYSRVGVRDWKEQEAEKENEIKNTILCFNREKPIWIENAIFKKIIREHTNFMDLSPPEQDAIIKDFLPQPPKERAIAIIIKTIKNVAKIDDKKLEMIETRLKNSEQFEAQMKKVGRSV